MGWFGNILKRLTSPLAIEAERRATPDAIVRMLNIPNRTYGNTWEAATRTELTRHYTGWNYVAVKAIAETFALHAPLVGRIRDGDEVRGELKKSLAGLSGYERRSMLAAHQSKYSRRNRRKALAALQDSDEIEPVSSKHELVKLLRNPNGPDVAYTFWFKVAMYWELTGAAYIWTPTDGYGKVAEMWVIPSHWVIEIPGEEQLVGRYQIRPTAGIVPHDGGFGVGWFPGMGGACEIDAQHIIKIANPSPYSLTGGYAPTTAGGAWIDISDKMDQTRVMTFANSMFPGVVLELDPAVKDFPTDAEMERVQEQFAQRYAGIKNAKKPVILAPGITANSLAANSVELDHVNGADQMKTWILALRRVPQSIAGITEESTFNNAAAARSNFHNGTMKPKFSHAGQVLTECLASRYDEDLIIYWSDPTQEDPESRRADIQTRLQGNAITPNEIREMYGDEPWEHGGDDPLINGQPMPWATGEDPLAAMQGMFGGMGGQPGQQPPPGAESQPEPSPEAVAGVVDDLAGEQPEEEGKPVNRIPSMLGSKSLNGKHTNGVH